MDEKEALLLKAIKEWEQALHGTKGLVINRHLSSLGLSEKSFYREMAKRGYSNKKKKRSDSGVAKKPEKEDWKRIIIGIKSYPNNEYPLSTEKAKKIAIEKGFVPKEASSLHIASINRYARKIGMAGPSCRRIKAEYPNQTNHLLIEQSKYLFPLSNLGRDWLLGPKLKDISETLGHTKVIAYSLVDDFFGFRILRYVVSKCISPLDTISFLEWAWIEEQKHTSFYGPPEFLFIENQFLTKKQVICDFCEQNNIKIRNYEGNPKYLFERKLYECQAELTQFERRLLIELENSKRQITLNDLNVKLMQFCKDANKRKHSFMGMSREVAWEKGLRRKSPYNMCDINEERKYSKRKAESNYQEVPTSKQYQVGILTISDKGHAGERADTAGPELARLLDPSCFKVSASKIVPDEPAAIAAQLTAWSDDDGLDLILTTGGTGLSPRDTTPEATLAVAQRLVPGIPEAMRAASLAVTPHAMLSRGVAVIRGRTLIINLPGSPKGARENLAAVAPALPHALEKLRGSPAECGAA